MGAMKSLSKHQWLTIVTIFVALATSVIFFCFKKPPTTISTVAVTKGSIIDQAEATGYIKTRHYSTVKSQSEGIVEAIYHDEGEYVTKGTPLLKIKPAPTPHEYAEKHQELANATSKEKEAKIVLKRYKQLLANNIIPINDINYTSAQNEHTLAKNSRILAEQKLALLEHGETIVAGKQIANIVISPIDGYILYRNVDIGDPIISTSSAQAATPLFVVANMQDLMFQGLVDERDAAKIKLGMDTKITVGSLPNHEITGKISKIALQSEKENQNNTNNSNADQNSPFNVGFKIEISDLQFPKDLTLRSGYSATAEIKIKKVDDILLIPIRLVQFKDTKPYVLLPTKDLKKPKHQPVELGVSDNINVEIKTGLTLGDKIIDQPELPPTN